MTVTILIPAYNAAEFLPKCLDSILKQTHSDLQVVIVDDGSKDDTYVVAQEYAINDTRVEVYHQENQGVAATRNNLLSKIKGDWVLFVDADDWIELNMVEDLVQLAHKHDSDLVMCDRVINDTVPSLNTPKVFELSQEQAVRDFLCHEYFIGSLCNKITKTSLLKGFQFSNTISYGEDALFCWDFLQKINKMVVTNKQFYHYRMNDQSISHQAFGEKKLTGHQTWTIISEDVKKRWPQYMDLALGTFALQDMYLLQQASMSGYPKDEHIQELQQNVRKNYKYLAPRLQKTRRLLLMGTIIMYWYNFGKMYERMHNCKEKFKKIIE